MLANAVEKIAPLKILGSATTCGAWENFGSRRTWTTTIVAPMFVPQKGQRRRVMRYPRRKMVRAGEVQRDARDVAKRDVQPRVVRARLRMKVPPAKRRRERGRRERVLAVVGKRWVRERRREGRVRRGDGVRREGEEEVVASCNSNSSV